MSNTRNRVTAWIDTLPGLFRATSEAEVWLAVMAAFKAWAGDIPDDFGLALKSCGYSPVHVATNRDKDGNIVSETWQLALPERSA
jgi:hypothetical protein